MTAFEADRHGIFPRVGLQYLSGRGLPARRRRRQAAADAAAMARRTLRRASPVRDRVDHGGAASLSIVVDQVPGCGAIAIALTAVALRRGRVPARSRITLRDPDGGSVGWQRHPSLQVLPAAPALHAPARCLLAPRASPSWDQHGRRRFNHRPDNLPNELIRRGQAEFREQSLPPRVVVAQRLQ